MSVTLVKPTAKDHDELCDYVNEIVDQKDAEGSNGLYTAILSGGFAKWLQKQNVPNADTYLILNGDNKIVGIINIRYELNEELKRCGGNIGYNIRPSERRKRYATEALKKALEIAADHDLSELYIDCYKENVASSKTIEDVGGILVSDNYNEKRRQSVLRYRVVLKELEQEDSPTLEELEEVTSVANDATEQIFESIPEDISPTIVEDTTIIESFDDDSEAEESLDELVEETADEENEEVVMEIAEELIAEQSCSSQIREMFALEYLKELLSVNPNVTEEMISPDLAMYLGEAKDEYKNEIRKK